MIYDVRCKKCGRQDEVIRSVADRDKDLPECCGATMRRIISLNQSVHPDFKPYLDENITSDQNNPEPIWVKSKQHRRELMKKHGVSENYGKGWI